MTKRNKVRLTKQDIININHLCKLVDGIWSQKNRNRVTFRSHEHLFSAYRFERGFSGDSYFGHDRYGQLWQVVRDKHQAIWFKLDDQGSREKADPPMMTTQQFINLFSEMR